MLVFALLAGFDADAGRPRPNAPVISNVAVVPDATSAAVTWTTNVPATSAVDYGLTSSFELGSIVAVGPMDTAHAVVLSGLLPETPYFARVRSTDAGGRGRVGTIFEFTTLSEVTGDPSGFRSDDFNSCALDTGRWHLEDPVGDSDARVTGGGTGDAQLELQVGAGPSHNPWIVNTASRLLQPIANDDLSLEARFLSSVTQGQLQGLVVEESAARFLRFDTFHDGTSQRLFAAVVWDGVAGILVDQPIATASFLDLRVERAGDQWTLSYGFEGGSWTPVATVPRAMNATNAGIVAGNFGTPGSTPAHTAIVDYVFSSAFPILEEDLASVPEQVSLGVFSNGPGSVEAAPADAMLACGTRVTLTALPYVGAELTSWTGALSGRQNPAELLVLGDTSVTANFAPDTTPPQILDWTVAPGPTGAILRWRTDEATTATIEFGETTAYELGVLDATSSAGLVHEAVLSDLFPLSAYHVRVQVVDAALLSTFSQDIAFTTTPANGSDPSGLHSDDFNTCVVDGNLWSVVNPLADATFEIVGAGSGDSRLQISIPAGTKHEPGPFNATARIVQDAADTDLAVEVRFTSDVTERYQEQGLLVEGAAGDYLRFDFYSDGASRFAYAAANTPTGATTLGNHLVSPGGDVLLMRVERSGDEWLQSWSLDGENWTPAASFTKPMTVTGVGVFAGNEGSGGVIPAHTAEVDWFSVVATPAVPEDLLGTISTATLSISTIGPGSVQLDPDQTAFGCGESVAVTAVPEPGYAFAGWSGDLSGQTNPETLFMTADRSIEATFLVDTVPPVISNVEVFRTPTGAIVVWDTNEPASSLVRYGLTTSYGSTTPLDPALVPDHLVTIEGLDPLLDYEFQIESADGAGLVSVSLNVSGPAPQGPTVTIFEGALQEAGANGLPQPMWNLLGNAKDDDGVQSVTVSVNGGSAQALALGPDTFRLDRLGDFNAEIPYTLLFEGINQILVRATDGLGNQSVAIVSLDVTTSTIPAPDMTVDWSAAAGLQSVATPIDGDWEIEGSTVRAAEMGYDRLLGIGDLSWTDYEAEVSFTFHGFEGVFSSPSNGPALGMIARWPGHTPDGFQPARQWFPLGAFAAQRWQLSGSGGISQSTRMWGTAGLVLDSVSSIVMAPGLDYTMKIRVQGLGAGSSEYAFKLWPADEPEPALWTLQGIEASDTPAGSLLLVAHHVDVSWHSVRISPLP